MRCRRRRLRAFQLCVLRSRSLRQKSQVRCVCKHRRRAWSLPKRRSVRVAKRGTLQPDASACRAGHRWSPRRTQRHRCRSVWNPWHLHDRCAPKCPGNRSLRPRWCRYRCLEHRNRRRCSRAIDAKALAKTRCASASSAERHLRRVRSWPLRPRACRASISLVRAFLRNSLRNRLRRIPSLSPHRALLRRRLGWSHLPCVRRLVLRSLSFRRRGTPTRAEASLPLG